MSKSGSKRCALLVLGMHRSGTSAVTGSLGKVGVPLGSQLLAPGADNPKGYWEHEEAVRIDDALLVGLERSWDDVRPLPSDWQRTDAARVALRDIDALLASDFAGQPLFAVKDPRMCLVLPVWLAALEKAGIEPRALLVARHPAEVAASIGKRNGWSRAVSEALWLEYMLSAERDSRGCPRASMTYDRFIQSPSRYLARALERAGLDDAARAAAACDLSRFVSVTDRHHRVGGDVGSDMGLAANTTQCYQLFAGLADTGRARADAAFDDVRKRSVALLAASAGLVDGVAAMAATLREQVEAIRQELLACRSELNAQMEWSQEAVACRESLQSELAEARSQLSAQLDWSEAAVSEREALQAELAKVRSELTAQLAWSQAAVDEREGLQADLAQVRSELDAQLAWADGSVKERESLQVQLAEVRSQLTAQMAWSQAAVDEREGLQADLAQVRSELDAQLAWADESVKERESLQAQLAEARSALNAQLAWSQAAVDEREGLQADLARSRSELGAQLAWADESVKERESLQAQLAEARSELTAQLAWSQAAVDERERLQADLAEVRSRLHAQMAWSDDAVVVQDALRLQLHQRDVRIAALDGVLAEATAQKDALQYEIAMQQATWLGRLNLKAMAWRRYIAELATKKSKK